MMCPMGTVYKVSETMCEHTCASLVGAGEQWCETHVVDGCFCPDGQVMHQGECTPVEECPCFHNGRPYLPGTTMTLNCQQW